MILVGRQGRTIGALLPEADYGLNAYGSNVVCKKLARKSSKDKFVMLLNKYDCQGRNKVAEE